MKKLFAFVFMMILMFSTVISIYAEDKTLAFPGAEGGGKFSLGARGVLDDNGKIEVYHVTNLNNSGKNSFVDAVSKEGRIIVFDVSGTIELAGTLRINKSNLTILGQTAPGDGITITGGDVILGDNVKNVIIRYLKVRPSDKNGGEPDGIGGRFNSNIIFDHCSVSWCVDELLTLYAGSSEEGVQGSNLTIQNTIGSESLRMSNHVKGAHGYGAILGGTNASYLYNLLAHHDSRSPRMDRELQKTEFSNNVIYNWGQTNSAYGAEPYSYSSKTHNPSYLNWIGNYYKYGPSTRESLRYRVFDISSPKNEGDEMSKFYFYDNYVNGVGTINDYKNNTYVNNYSKAELLTEKLDMGDYSFNSVPSLEAYNYVLNNVGATLPKRDAIDARIINDVKNGTGRVINNADEIGGFIPIKEERRIFKIPNEWLTEYNLNSMSETDIVKGGEFDGYTVIEAYINNWTEEQSKITPTNPNIIVQSPAVSALDSSIDGLEINNGEWTVINENESLNYKATGIAVGDSEVCKIELYDKNKLLTSFDGNIIDENILLGQGTHFLTCRAYNTKGEQTQSASSIVYVKSVSSPGSYLFTEIRENNYKGGYNTKGGASMDEKTGIYTIYGSGRIAEKQNDNCGFMYKSVSGDFDLIVRTEEIPKFENQQVSGLMVRTGLDSKARMAMIGDGWWKNGENVHIFSRTEDGVTSSENYFKDASGKDCDNNGESYTMPNYMRIQRNGNSITLSVSNSGITWNDNGRQPFTINYPSLPDTMYVGIAVDSAFGVSSKEYFSIAKFSRLTLNGESDVAIKDGYIPFNDTRFNNAEWYIPSGSGEKDFSLSPLDGNNGYALLFWGETYRNFNPQNKGIFTTGADFYVKSNKDSVNEKAGMRFMLNGISQNGENTKIKSFYAQHLRGFFEDYDNTTLPIPESEIKPCSEEKFELEKWYNIKITLNYDTGKGFYSFRPYTEYDSANNVYTIGETICDVEFIFDTNISVSQLHFQRYGGFEMYLDNVWADTCIDDNRILYINENGKLTVDKPNVNAILYVVSFSENGILTNLLIENISEGEKKSFDIPKAHKVKVFLWDENMRPLCKTFNL